MKSFRKVALGALSALLVVGCNDKSKDEALDLDGVAKKAAEIVCDALVTCSCTDASVKADCRTAYEEVVTVALSAGQIVLTGVKIDQVAARTCLDELRAQVAGCPSPTWWEYDPPFSSKAGLAATRAMPVTLLDSCMAAVVGVQTTDEHCGNPLACAEGLSCDPRTMTCAAQATAGQSCAFVECAEGLLCNGSDVCVAIPGLSQPCPDDECQTGLFCDNAGTFDPADDTCKSLIAIDGTCTSDSTCVAGAYCDTTCKAFKADGQTCLDSSECLHGWCNDVDTTTTPKCADPGFCAMFDELLNVLPF